jgi:hypothetical protein
MAQILLPTTTAKVNLNLSELASLVHGVAADAVAAAAAAKQQQTQPEQMQLLPGGVEIDDLAMLWAVEPSAPPAAAGHVRSGSSLIVVRAPPTCLLFSFMGELALRLGYYGGPGRMMDWKAFEVLRLGPDSTDVEVLRAMRHGGYAVSRTLFWMQNRECLSHIHLMRDIITSREWRARFFDVLSTMIVEPLVAQEDVREELRRPALMARLAVYERDIKREQENARQLRARLMRPFTQGTIDDLVTVTPFALPRRPLSPIPSSKRSVTLTLSMFRDAARNQDLTFDHLQLTIARFCRNVLHQYTEAEIKATEERLASRHHSIVMFARLMAMDFQGRAPNKAAEKIWEQERATLTAWIRGFLDHGCACTS